MGPQAAARVQRAGKVSRRTVIARASIARTSKGRFLMVKVSSASSRAKISIRLMAKKKVLATKTRTIATNKTVKVMKVSSRVIAAKINLVG